jgi:hypothetical protein
VLFFFLVKWYQCFFFNTAFQQTLAVSLKSYVFLIVESDLFGFFILKAKNCQDSVE